MSERAGRRWSFGDCEYVEISRRLTVDGKPVKMEAKPLDVLLQLLESPGRVVAKEHLLDTVWADVETTEQSLTTAISKLRKVFIGSSEPIIVTVAGVGYRMGVPVRCDEEPDSGSFRFALQPGDRVPGRPYWQALRKLSSNQSSPVWLARHEKTGEERVYKFAVDGLRLRALQREITAFRLLTKALGERASFMVQIYDWSFDDLPFFTESEYCGLNLLEWSNTDAFRLTSLDERVRIAALLAGAIASAHSLAVFHNDLKPANILVLGNPGVMHVNEQGAGRLEVKIADFGVASLQNPELLRELEISDLGSFVAGGGSPSGPVGTAMYRAPELHSGGPSTAIGDVYSLGVLLYQLVTGSFHEPPSPGWEKKVTDQLLRQDIADAANVNPDQRIATVAELAQRLETLPQRREEKQLSDLAAAESSRIREEFDRMRLRRPWVALAIVSLIFGLLVTLWTVRRILGDRDSERRRNASLASMYDFLAIDLLGQSNPSIPGSGGAPQQTLLDAIATATPQIDSRFSHQPEIAARLHLSIADSLRSRTRFREADQEYQMAAQHFREADGPLSQDAIIAELEREYSSLTAMLPGSLDAARQAFQAQEALIARLKKPTVDLEAWETLVKSTLIGMGPNPNDALPLLITAIRRAETTPGFDPLLLVRLKKQFCGMYVRLGDGPNLERVSREIIALLTHQSGSESATLFPYQMYLEEAFLLEGKYPETIAQADQNFARFDSVLGRENQLTLATLATRAAAEAQLERYKDAARDDLSIYTAAHLLPSGIRMAEGSLNDAATFECRSGDFQSGIEHARQVTRETGPGPLSQPMFFNGSMFTLAECLLSEQEATPSRKNVSELSEARSLLTRVDVRAMAVTSGENPFEGARDVALARLALLQGDLTSARQNTDAAEAFFSQSDSDPYEKKALLSVKKALVQRQSSGGPK